MKKTKYIYNPNTLSYEQVERSPIVKIFLGLGIITSIVLIGFLFNLVLGSFGFSNADEKIVLENQQYKKQLNQINSKVGIVYSKLEELKQRDANIYREIFEAEPLDENMRNGGFGGSDKYSQLDFLSDGDLLKQTHLKIDQLLVEIDVQQKSFEELNKLAKNKSKMLSSIPAIQPIPNKNLKRLASGFGNRLHPIYKTVKFHEGLDFSAQSGTPIYATGNGVVVKSSYSGGYGKLVEIDHGYGYKTRYAHMSRFKARKGQKVKRGDIIGYVGNTGSSTGPHLHYEVLKNGKPVNPVNYFFNDLTNEEYAEMIKRSNHANQSFD